MAMDEPNLKIHEPTKDAVPIPEPPPWLGREPPAQSPSWNVWLALVWCKNLAIDTVRCLAVLALATTAAALVATGIVMAGLVVVVLCPIVLATILSGVLLAVIDPGFREWLHADCETPEDDPDDSPV